MIDSAAFNAHNPDCEYVATVHTVVERDRLTDEQHMICLPYAVGFSFGNKRWGMNPLCSSSDEKVCCTNDTRWICCL
jgi:hypothetical protein